jgi:hypothetical protein
MLHLQNTCLVLKSFPPWNGGETNQAIRAPLSPLAKLGEEAVELNKVSVKIRSFPSQKIKGVTYSHGWLATKSLIW